MKYTLETKLVAQVRYYEKFYVVRDAKGERVYTGTSERMAKRVQTLLNRDVAARKKRRRKPPQSSSVKRRK